jgi:hypothetical protein
MKTNMVTNDPINISKLFEGEKKKNIIYLFIYFNVVVQVS